jgi:hypothetical protein
MELYTAARFTIKVEVLIDDASISVLKFTNYFVPCHICRKSRALSQQAVGATAASVLLSLEQLVNK